MIAIRHIRRIGYSFIVGAVTLAAAAADAPKSSARIAPEGIRGALVICGGGRLPDSIWERFVKLAGGKSARVVVVPTAGSDEQLEDRERLLEPWRKHDFQSVQIVHTRSRDEANQDGFIAPLRDATAVWFSGGQQSRIADVFVGTAFERELLALLERGGVVGGTSAGAAVMSRLMIAGGNPIPTTATGFDLLPNTVIDQHFRQRERQPRLVRIIAEHPGHVGIGIDEGTALVVERRRMEVVGDNHVSVLLSGSPGRAAKVVELKSGQAADLTALRRAARERAQPHAQATSPTAVSVPHGALLLGGGGRLSLDVARRFVELAGGPEALIVVLPTASEAPSSTGGGERQLLERAGAKNLVILRGTTPDEVESQHSLKALEDAKGIWFGGGRQWRFVDAYEGTKAVELFHNVLKRGGVIGGSSAGASIQAEYLVRGSPLGNLEMMAEGYERGFGFLPGTAVDQHFTQRKRQQDMEALVAAHPELLGIGLDEGAALLVRGETAEVLGSNSVHFFDRSTDSENASSIEVRSGQRFDLRARKLLP